MSLYIMTLYIMTLNIMHSTKCTLHNALYKMHFT
jgi:hypothetical protein